MALKQWCGKHKCSECHEQCNLDLEIPCNPDCDNLTSDGNILIKDCLKSGCEEVRYIFDMIHATDEEIINKYGEIAKYPYSVE